MTLTHRCRCYGACERLAGLCSLWSCAGRGELGRDCIHLPGIANLAVSAGWHGRGICFVFISQPFSIWLEHGCNCSILYCLLSGMCTVFCLGRTDALHELDTASECCRWLICLERGSRSRLPVLLLWAYSLQHSGISSGEGLGEPVEFESFGNPWLWQFQEGQRGGRDSIGDPCHVPSESKAQALRTVASAARQRGGWVFPRGPGHVPTESMLCENGATRCPEAVPLIDGQRGGRDSIGVPCHVPSESIAQDLRTLASAARQRGGWVFLGGPGHVPTESMLCENDATRCPEAVPIIAGQRGGRDLQCEGPGHVPSESMPEALVRAKIFREPVLVQVSAGRRGGWDSFGAPGHVPTESVAVAPTQGFHGKHREYETPANWLPSGLHVPTHLCLCDYLPICSIIWDSTPRILAGGQRSFLHRQIMLSRLCALTNLGGDKAVAYHNCWAPIAPVSSNAGVAPNAQSSPFPCIWVPTETLLQGGATYACVPQHFLSLQDRCLQGQRGGLLHSAGGHVPSESKQARWLCLSDLGDTSQTSAFKRNPVIKGPVLFVYSLQLWLESGIELILEHLGLLFVQLANELQCFFRTLALLGLVYCLKLWTYALLLRGGQRNWDPLLRTARAFGAACPLGTGAGLVAFSPRLMQRKTLDKSLRNHRRQFSGDFLWLLLVVCICLQGADAAQGWHYSSQPTQYPAADMTHGYDHQPRGLERHRQAARNFDSPSEDESSPGEESEESDPDSCPPSPTSDPIEDEQGPCIFKVIGFGHRPEYLCQTFRRGVTLNRALELIDVELQVGPTCGNGIVQPLQGSAITDEVLTMWRPTWTTYALGRVIIVDATLLGMDLFQLYCYSGVITADEFRRLLPPLCGREFWVYIPSQQQRPLLHDASVAAGRAVVSNGDVVHLVPEPLPPAVHPEAEASFQTFPQWGGLHYWDGFEEPLGQTFLMVLSEYNSILIPFVQDESDENLAVRACEQLDIHPHHASLVRPQYEFFQPTHLCFPLKGVFYLLTEPLGPWEVVVFLDKRPICQSFAAVRLPCTIIPVQEAVTALQLRVEVVESHRLWVKGGQKLHGDLVVHHRCTLSVRLEHEDCEYFSSGDEAPSSGIDEADDGENFPQASRPAAPGGLCPNAGDNSSAVVDSEPRRGTASPTQGRSGGGLWRRVLALAHCFSEGQSLRHAGNFEVFSSDPTCLRYSSLLPEADQWGEKMWKPTYSDFHGGGPGADTPRFFSSVGDAFGLVLLTKRFPGTPCGFLAWIALQSPLVSAAVVLPTVGDDFSEDGDREVAGILPSVPQSWDCSAPVSLLDDYAAVRDCIGGIPGAIDVSVSLSWELCTLLDENRGEDLWCLCGALADFLQPLAFQHDNIRPPVQPAHDLPRTKEKLNATCSRQQLCLYDLLETHSDGEGTLNSLFRFVQIPNGWLLPALLLRPWEAFTLIWDVSSWNLHENTVIALSLAETLPINFVGSGDLHLYTDGSAINGRAGWSVVIVSVDASCDICHFAGCFGGRIPGDESLGADSADALQAEQCALCWACLWVLPQLELLLRTYHRILFCWDCTTAGLGASGDCCLADSPLSSPLRGLFALLQATGGNRIQGRHIKAHEGHPWNELADVAANRFRKAEIEFMHLRCVAEAFGSVDWQWAPVVSSAGLPPVHFGREGAGWGFRFPRHNGCIPPNIVPIRETEHAFNGDVQGPDWRSISLKAASANVQGLTGKHKFLEEQFLADGYDFICLQETKTKGGMFSSKAFHRFASEHDKHWGVAVWVRRSITLDGSSRLIDVADCRALVSEPRLIAVKVVVDSFRILCISAHLPQQAHGQHARSTSFSTLRDVLGKASPNTVVILGIDANARLPCGFAQVTGNVEHGEPDAFGYRFAEFLSECGLWAPATFAEIHSGETATWRHAQGSTSRIDFICVGRALPCSHVHSWVACDLDLLTAQEDHRAVAFSGVFWQDRSSKGAGHLWRGKYDLPKLGSPEGKELIRDAFAKTGSIPWEVGVNEHAFILEQVAHDVLDRHFASKRDGPRSSYISDEVWSLRERRNRLKSHTRFWKEGRSTALLKVGFAALSGRRCVLDWCKIDFLFDLFAAAVRFSTGRIKSSICADKQHLLKSLISGSEGGSLQRVQRAIKQCGLGSRAKSKGGRPIPILLDGQGQPISSRADLDAHWLQHFGEMEAGCTVSFHEFVETANTYQPPVDVDIDWTILPTFQEVEAQFRQVRCGAASGLDGLPPEVFKAAPQALAALFHPLMVKSALCLVQPVQWRGGILFEAYKNSGSPALSESYRSLFVSSVPGKCYHRILRNKAAGVVEEVMDPLHCGGRKGRPVVLPAFAAHLLVRAHKAKRLSFCAVFLDTRSAYYRVVRELAFGSMEDDEAVIALFRRFGVPSADLHELMAVVHAGGIMSQAGLGEHHRALVQDLHALSWFVTPYTDGSKVALSKAGSRPGESWADIVFAFVYSKVLGEIKRAAVQEDLTLQIPGNEDRSPFIRESAVMPAWAPVHATWADDSVFFTGDVSAIQALSKAKRLASLILDSCRKHGMQPNMKRGKSAMILALRGKHSRAVRRQFFRDVDDKLAIALSDGSTASIFLEVQYTHLGTVLHRDGTMLPEARLRIGVGAAAYKKYERLLFSNRSIEQQLRIQLFETLVTGVFYNLALWTTSCRGWDHLAKGYALLQRRLLHTHISTEDIFTLRATDVAAVLDVSDMAVLCCRRRLGFLATLVAVGDGAIWALLTFEADWARQVCDDLRWLWATVQTALPFPDHASWPEWAQFILQKPRTFKALIRRAGTAHRRQVRLETLTMRTLRLLGAWECGQCPDVPREVCRPFWCGPCLRPFRSKAALATHFFQMHGRVARFRHFVQDNLCRACGRRFRGMQQLALHLRASTSCCDTLSTYGFWSESVLPGIGSSEWLDACRRDLGLTLPTEPTQQVPATVSAALQWEENHVLVAAYMCGAERLLEAGEVNADTAFQFCLDLADFPLFPDELDSTARKVQELLADSDIACSLDLCAATQHFFAGEGELFSADSISEEVLCDSFWRVPSEDRPPPSGDWSHVHSPTQGMQLDKQALQLVVLENDWHSGDWPPGLCVPKAERQQLHSRAAQFLQLLLEGLTEHWGWLIAPREFWDSAISIPFQRFHHAS